MTPMSTAIRQTHNRRFHIQDLTRRLHQVTGAITRRALNSLHHIILDIQLVNLVGEQSGISKNMQMLS